MIIYLQGFNLRPLRVEDFNVDALIEQAFDASGLSETAVNSEADPFLREDYD